MSEMIDKRDRAALFRQRLAEAMADRGVTRAGAHAGLRLGGWGAPELALRRFDWLYGHDVTKGA